MHSRFAAPRPSSLPSLPPTHVGGADRRRASWGDRPAGLGRVGANLVQLVSLVNAAIFMVAIGFAMTADVLVAEALSGVGHWHSGQRNLVVVDHTGAPEWEQATKHAVEVWNQSGAGVRLVWTSGPGPCRQDGTRVHVCALPRRVLSRVGVPGLEGLAAPKAGDGDHYESAIIQVCSDCGIRSDRALVVAVHELGHVLGLEHSRSASSVMHPSGGPGRPSERDFSELRARYLHDDG